MPMERVMTLALYRQTTSEDPAGRSSQGMSDNEMGYLPDSERAEE